MYIICFSSRVLLSITARNMFLLETEREHALKQDLSLSSQMDSSVWREWSRETSIGRQEKLSLFLAILENLEL